MIRRVIEINQEKCNGCGACVTACQEGAIGLVEGKAVLLRDDYCDGLGNCLPACPTDAIQFIEREAAEFDEEAVKKHMEKQAKPHQGGCPGTMARQINREEKKEQPVAQTSNVEMSSQLNQWPVQIKLVSPNAPYLNGADLLIAADCTAYAYGNFHQEFIKDKITLIGCPKLDEGDYSHKLAELLTYNDIKSVTVVRMEVPCCGGIVNAVKDAFVQSGKMIPWQVVTISTTGEVIK